MSSTDRIEKKVLIRAPRARVWLALTDVEEFNAWFGVRLRGVIEPGARLEGNITHPVYEHLTMTIEVERVEAPSRFSYRWHPYAVDPGVDYSSEPTTLVEFTLEEAAGGGTTLTIVESGFDRIPASRRAKAFEMNDGGWTEQARRIAAHVDGAAA
jgi:uncharacterized protein YndB with AHSA1/START domain